MQNSQLRIKMKRDNFYSKFLTIVNQTRSSPVTLKTTKYYIFEIYHANTDE